MLILIYLAAFIHYTSCQASQWIDTFQKDLCRDRWSQMDWQSILRPCRFNTAFGKHKYDVQKRTSPKWSHTTSLHFEKTGEFSKVTLQTRTGDGRNKDVGGDTWRMFVRGGDRVTPFISDLNNGVYEAQFIVFQPGLYKVEVVLESTLCEAFKDPPQDWLKREAKTIISDEKNADLIWEPLRGGNISLKIEESPLETVKALRRNFMRWKEDCGPQYKCDLLWKGFGRWANSTWLPYIDEDDDRDTEEGENRCFREKEGVLKMTGDDMTREISHFTKNSSLCNGVFNRCESDREGEQPDAELYSKRDKGESKVFSTKTYLHELKELLKKDYMGEKSGLLLNYGHPFVQNLGFKQYRSFIDRAVRIVKEKYKGKPLWRSMATKWKESAAPEDHFANHQRIKLFNAYATSAMCNAGIPVLDVFQMTESAPPNDRAAVLRTVEKIVTKYFKDRPTKKCTKKKKTKISKLKKLNETLNFMTPRDKIPANETITTINGTAATNTASAL